MRPVAGRKFCSKEMTWEIQKRGRRLVYFLFPNHCTAVECVALKPNHPMASGLVLICVKKQDRLVYKQPGGRKNYLIQRGWRALLPRCNRAVIQPPPLKLSRPRDG